jgi:two-component system NtrC family response regulator
VLESGEIRRVGENESFEVDVRVICATHRRLDDMVASDEFREDLMYRINTFEIRLPSLRERIEDVAELARHLLLRFRPTARPDDELLSPEVIDALTQHTWPGNVRELANIIEHSTILCDSGPIQLEHLPQRLTSPHARAATVRKFGPQSLRDIELNAIHEALERHGGNKPKAADELGVSLKTLYNKLNQATTMEKSA